MLLTCCEGMKNPKACALKLQACDSRYSDVRNSKSSNSGNSKNSNNSNEADALGVAARYLQGLSSELFRCHIRCPISQKRADFTKPDAR